MKMFNDRKRLPMPSKAALSFLKPCHFRNNSGNWRRTSLLGRVEDGTEEAVAV